MSTRPHLLAALSLLALACTARPAPKAAPLPVAPPPPPVVALAAQPSPEEVAIDRIFADFQGADRPGCVVGVERDGHPVLTKAYGVANLEDGRPNAAETIFEAASVSKQFTSAAVVLLARQGKLSLDDDVRKFLPELPAYPTPVTLRRMLTHTSGLRDWGAIEDVAGWPRGSRTYTQAWVLDLMRRQRALNFPPGTATSYSNSNYNLAAMVVERVSGLSFAEFTRQNVFVPLGMTHTSWRDDFTRLVPGRATAYSMGKDHAWHIDMPIEDVIGNCGLLTTVGDLLRWNANFAHPLVGDAAFVTTLETEGTLASGRSTGYALGLVVDTSTGVRTVSHDGQTAGYRSYLERVPSAGLSIALLCNARTANTGALTHAVRALFAPLPQAPPPESPKPPDPALTAAVASITGLYRSERTGAPATITAAGARAELKADMVDLEGGLFAPVSTTTFVSRRGSRLEVLPSSAKGSPPRLRVDFFWGDVLEISRVVPWAPDAHALAALEGEYASDEADARFLACVRDGKLVLLQGPERVVRLEPVYDGVFRAPEVGWLVTFRRTGGRVAGMDVGSGRMWRLPFARVGAGSCAERGAASQATLH
jgi:CubicO group peptidase (beta-lactamase class C family)